MGVLPHVAVGSGLTLDAAAPMFAADDDLTIVRWNERAEALLGFSEAEMRGRRCFEVAGCPEIMRRAVCRGCRARPHGGGRELVPAFDQQFTTRSGDKVWVNVATLVAAAPGGPALRVHLLRDLTRERELQDVIRQIIGTASRVSAEPDRPGEGDGRGPAPPAGVTAREREVIRLLAGGNSTKAIAATLGISRRTARNHVQNILGKLRLHSRLEVVAYAAARRLV